MHYLCASMKGKVNIRSLTQEELTLELVALGEKKFRSTQVFEWLWKKNAASFEDMTNLSLSLREKLDTHFFIDHITLKDQQISSDKTIKCAFAVDETKIIEGVLIPTQTRTTACISSQVGCSLACKFCATGYLKRERNLDAAEIYDQVILLNKAAQENFGRNLTNIVFMGMGEPLANLDRVLGALDVARSADGLGISPRRVTISTVGLPVAIDRLSRHAVPYNLAVSLHAPNDQLRSKLVPVNRKIGVTAVMEAADRYFEASGRRLTFEYVLLGGENDSQTCAEQLASLLRGRSAMLNVIPYNPVAGLPYRTPSGAAISRFRDVLQRHGITDLACETGDYTYDGAAAATPGRKTRDYKESRYGGSTISAAKTVA